MECLSRAMGRATHSASFCRWLYFRARDDLAFGDRFVFLAVFFGERLVAFFVVFFFAAISVAPHYGSGAHDLIPAVSPRTP